MFVKRLMLRIKISSRMHAYVTNVKLFSIFRNIDRTIGEFHPRDRGRLVYSYRGVRFVVTRFGGPQTRPLIGSRGSCFNCRRVCLVLRVADERRWPPITSPDISCASLHTYISFMYRDTGQREPPQVIWRIY